MKHLSIILVAACLCAFCVSCGSGKKVDPATSGGGSTSTPDQVTTGGSVKVPAPPFEPPSGDWDLSTFVYSENPTPDAAKISAHQAQIKEARSLLTMDKLTQAAYQAQLERIADLEDKIAQEEGRRPAVLVPPTIRFGPGTRISGSGGCNVWNGSLETTGEGKATLGEITVTEKSCDPTTDKQEQDFVAGLSSTTRIENRGDELRFIASDDTFLSFTPSAPTRR